MNSNNLQQQLWLALLLLHMQRETQYVDSSTLAYKFESTYYLFPLFFFPLSPQVKSKISQLELAAIESKR